MAPERNEKEPPSATATFTRSRGRLAVHQAGADGDSVEVIEYPLVATRKSGRRTVRNEINENAVADWVIDNQGQTGTAFVEQVGAMPKQGVSSTFRFGMAYGIIRGILAARGLPYQLVRPQVWKKAMGVGRDKDECRLLAARMFPKQADLFVRKKDANRAEAVLIAVYGHKYG